MSTTLTDAVAAVQAKEAELLKILNDSVTPVLNALAEIGTLGVIYVYGYTPGFNDGEPCEHSTDFFVGLREVANEERMDEFLSMIGKDSDAMGDYDGVDYKSKWRGDSEEDVAAYQAERDSLWVKVLEELGIPETGEYDQKTVHAAINEVVIPALDREFHTNYQVAYVFKDGSFERFDDEYDCGY